MDMAAAIVPKSDQINAEDLLAGPAVFTIESVTKGSDEQPVNVNLAETNGRPWRPSKSMSRVLVHAWGRDADKYAGRKVKLFRNPEITFGRDKVGGIEIAELSHIEGNVALALTVRRGVRKSFVVKPLKEIARELEPGAVPADVIAKAEQYVASGKVQQYLDWLTEKGAPAHILDYVQSKLPKADIDEAEFSFGSDDPTAPTPGDVEPPLEDTAPDTQEEGQQ